MNIGTYLDSSGLFKNDGWKPEAYEIPMGKVLLIGVPAAFSPGCTNRHLPEFAQNMDRLKDYKVIFLSVETPYTMKAWNDQHGHEDIDSVGHPIGDFIKRLDELYGDWEQIMGPSCNRFAYLVEDRVVIKKFDEPWFNDVANQLGDG